jgi:hypothetical protein
VSKSVVLRLVKVRVPVEFCFFARFGGGNCAPIAHCKVAAIHDALHTDGG